MAKETVATLSNRISGMEELMVNQSSMLQALLSKGGVEPKTHPQSEPEKRGEIQTPTIFQAHEVTTEVAKMIRKQGGHCIWIQEVDRGAGITNEKGTWETTHGLGEKYTRKDGSTDYRWTNLPNSDLVISSMMVGRRVGDDGNKVINQSAFQAIQAKMAEIEELKRSLGI